MSVEEGKAFKHLIHMEEWIIRLLKSLEDQGKTSEKEKNDLYPSDYSAWILYWLAKIHKALEDDTPSFIPILPAIGTPSYNLAKFWTQLLTPLTNIDYTIEDSISFTKEVIEFYDLVNYVKFWYKGTFHHHTFNKNVKHLRTNFLLKSNTCW